jgi:hypothetical protein
MPDQVSVIYVVPSDREPWREAQLRATECLEDLQWFFADEMTRLGYGPKTFDMARDTSGLVLFQEIDSELEASAFRHYYWQHCKNTARTLRDGNQVIVYFFEAYFLGDKTTNTSAGSRGGRNRRGRGGEAFLSSLHLKLARRDWLGRDDGYEGRVFEWIGPSPLEPGSLSWNCRGPALGDVSGAGFGVIAHEFAHCFGPPPQESSRCSRYGPLMGDGCRGMRGFFRPNETNDRCLLRPGDGAVFDNNSFFGHRELKPRSHSFG